MKNEDDVETLVFKTASEPWEFEAIHTLNYRTFVEEIPQHARNESHSLVDKFHDQNTYVICVRGCELLGMIAIHDKRPFSLDYKLQNIESYLPDFESIFEIRLLAVENKYRNTTVFTGMLKKIFELALERGYDLGIVSGTTRQIRLYQHIGLKPFGPLVGKEGALYQPMYITFDHAMTFKRHSHIFKDKRPAGTGRAVFNYLPGPVPVVDGVMEAYLSKPDSHREHRFVSDFNHLQKALCKRVNAEKVYILMGSGTLANDIVSAQLSLLGGKGLVLINGEFGRRLEDHAARAELNYETYSVADGQTFDMEELTEIIQTTSDYRWLWAVQCETSTGVLNDVPALRDVCRQRNIKLCLDSISAIGSCHVDLDGVYLASASSGKGIGSLPGLALVFGDRQAVSSGQRQLPRYFDLSYYDQKNGIPHTVSSNAIHALSAALGNSNWGRRFVNIQQWSEELRESIEGLGFAVLARKPCRAPHITTITLPEEISSLELGRKMADAGFLISYRSEHLLRKNRIQICFMGECQRPTHALVYHLQQAIQAIKKENKKPSTEVEA